MLNINWSWDNLPSNADEISPLASETVDGEEVFMFYNHTRKRIFFEHDGNYGVLKKEEV